LVASERDGPLFLGGEPGGQLPALPLLLLLPPGRRLRLPGQLGLKLCPDVALSVGEYAQRCQ